MYLAHLWFSPWFRPVWEAPLAPPCLDAHFRVCRLSHLHFKCSQSQRRRFTSDILPYPNFHPLSWNMLWKPPRSLPGWHVFHARDEQFSSITSEGRPLSRHAARPRLTRTIRGFFLFCFFVLSREERLSDAATSDDRSRKSEFNRTPQ